MPYLTIPSLVAPMHRARGKLSMPLPGSGGHWQRARGASPTKGRAPVRLPATPEATQVGVRQSPCLSAAAAVAAPAVLAASRSESVDGEDSVARSQDLLSPPPLAVASTFVCNWAQAIQCGYPNLKPLPCQKEGCNALVHHLC
jgi:hypothetical protein